MIITVQQSVIKPFWSYGNEIENELIYQLHKKIDEIPVEKLVRVQNDGLVKTYTIQIQVL